MSRWILSLMLTLMAASAYAADTLEALFSDYDEAWLELNPDQATSRREDSWDDRLPDRISPAWLARREALVGKCLARL